MSLLVAVVLHYQIIPVTHYQQNCTLLWCDETLTAAVVDPGGDIEKILKVLSDHKLSVSTILLTHGHLDHVGGTAALVKALTNDSGEVPPVVGPHADDMFWINMLPQQAQMMGFPPPTQFSPDRLLTDGESVSFGNIKLEVVHCPGHTPGHIIFFHADSKLALVGDVLFKGSVGRTDFPRGNYEDLVHSIREKLWPLGDDVKFIPGHGPMSTFGAERLHNAFVADKHFG